MSNTALATKRALKPGRGLQLSKTEQELLAINKSLTELEGWIDTAEPERVPAAYQFIQCTQTLLRLRNDLEELRKRATRMEARILRRLGKMDPKALRSLKLRDVDRNEAAKLARWDDEKFTAFLEFIDNRAICTLTSHFDKKNLTEEQAEAILQGRIARARRRYPSDGAACIDYLVEEANSNPLNIRDAINVLVGDVLNQDGDFSVSGVAKTLSEKLGIELCDVTNAGLCDFIGKAISCGEEHYWALADDTQVDIPSAVTYKDETWVRVPWQRAGLDQLRFMATYRTQQANEMQRSASNLQLLLSILEKVSDDCPKSCDELLRQAVHMRLICVKDDACSRDRTKAFEQRNRAEASK